MTELERLALAHDVVQAEAYLGPERVKAIKEWVYSTHVSDSQWKDAEQAYNDLTTGDPETEIEKCLPWQPFENYSPDGFVSVLEDSYRSVIRLAVLHLVKE